MKVRTLAILAALGLAAIIGYESLRNRGDSAPAGLTDADVIHAARYAVTRTLADPSSAQFPLPESGKYSLSKLAEKTFEVSGYVDAKNAFNAKVRQPWTCRVTFTGAKDENVTASFIEIDGRTVFGKR